MGNSNEKQSEVDGIATCHADINKSPSLSKWDELFKNNFQRLLQETDADHKQRRLVPAYSLLAIFPAKLKHVGEEFIRMTINKYPQKSQIPQNLHSVELIGDSVHIPSIVPSTNSQTPQILQENPAEGGKDEIGFELVNEQQFVSMCKIVCDTKEGEERTRLYTNLCNRSQGKMTVTDCERVINTCCAASMMDTTNQTSSLDTRVIVGLVQDIFGKRTEISADDLHSWITSNNLALYNSLHTWLVDALKTCHTVSTL